MNEKPMFPNDGRMKPMIILPPNAMSDHNIGLLRENGICVVVAKNPSDVKFLDPIPSVASRSQIEAAAIALSRKILKCGTYNEESRSNFARLYVDLLVKGTPLDPEKEKEEQIFKAAKEDEIRRLAREEAKSERQKQKSNVVL